MTPRRPPSSRRPEPHRKTLPPLDLEVVPATIERWRDVALLLGQDGDRGCWCQSWRHAGRAFGRSDGGSNRELLTAQLTSGEFAPGLLAYATAEPVGWCGLGPRAAMPRLMRSRTIPLVDDVAVWSIGCFKIRVGYRRRGVARALLRGAVDYARASGAPAIEAYPIDAEGERVDVGFGYVGFTTMFEQAGFRRVQETQAHSAGRVRWLMRLELASDQPAAHGVMGTSSQSLRPPGLAAEREGDGG